tara:strand:- start:7 stop:180 length:174 start_codon:yes stop_codon:yes gene_type:complete
MEWDKVIILINEAITTKKAERVKDIIKEIQADKETPPNVIEAIQSGLAPEMFNKLFN